MNGRLGLNCRLELCAKVRGHRCSQYVSKIPEPITFAGKESKELCRDEVG